MLTLAGNLKRKLTYLIADFFCLNHFINNKNLQFYCEVVFSEVELDSNNTLTEGDREFAYLVKEEFEYFKKNKKRKNLFIKSGGA